MIYITGDTHGQLRRFTARRWAPEDKVIVTGDFGFVFYGEINRARETRMLDALAKLPCEILFIDGNHEGFPHLEIYPETERYGSPVRILRGNIFWLQRGRVYTIEGHTFFTMGGASSPDRAFRENCRLLGGPPIWFPQELPSPEEQAAAWQTLLCHQNRVDYIITHTAPFSLIPQLTHTAPNTDDAAFTRFLDEVYRETAFRCWYCGHFHMDRRIEPFSGKPLVCCYEQVLPLAEP